MQLKIARLFLVNFLLFFFYWPVFAQENESLHWKDKKSYFFIRTPLAGQWNPGSIESGLQMPNARALNFVIGNTPGLNRYPIAVNGSNQGPMNPTQGLQLGFRIEERLWGIRGETHHETSYLFKKDSSQRVPLGYFFPITINSPVALLTSTPGFVDYNIYTKHEAGQFRYLFNRSFRFFNENNPYLKDLGLRLGLGTEANYGKSESDISLFLITGYRAARTKYESFGIMFQYGIDYKYTIKDKHVVGFSYDIVDGISQGKAEETLTILTRFQNKTEHYSKLMGSEYRFNYTLLDIFKDTNLKFGYGQREVTHTVTKSDTKVVDTIVNPNFGYYFTSSTNGILLGYLLSQGSDAGPFPSVKDRFQYFSMEFEFKF